MVLGTYETLQDHETTQDLCVLSNLFHPYLPYSSSTPIHPTRPTPSPSPSPFPPLPAYGLIIGSL
ncbi:hypothetical protein SODALDRAFT_333257 [Sodiomyces alkalinus F11]|uniref:Uncharacterized protein n=1 Tax=Sodiomyces alkalinus (strain CBS 110278 / VKM F-3762 / F11) TaxID=1314773 RepID=A0A3N2PVW4_SODAK|nr:hypothetical protein SODALDRAFT_333257 [Sodiomyces alkalinus F11]ROT38639.1 hypothetical protein SODALDRAFT_333257 [Sodiomyces alkalinus F11]